MKLKEVRPAKAYRLFYPNVVTLLTASFNDDSDVMPAISYCSLSFDPALFGVAISPKNFTYTIVKKSGCFALNIVDQKMAEFVAAAGDISAKNRKDKLAVVGLKLVEAKKIDGKVIKDASAVVECRVIDTINTGDHDFFVGKCEYAHAMEDFEDYWTYEKYAPALYAGSSTGKRGKKHRFAILSRRFKEFPYMSS